MNVARWLSSIGDVEPHDPGERAAGDHDVVERRERALGRAAAGQDRPGQRHPLRDVPRPLDELPEHGLQAVRLGLGQEADLAEVDPEDRHVDLGHGHDGAQERAVAAEHDEHVRRPAAPRRAAPSRRRARPSGRCPGGGTSRPRARTGRPRPRSWGCTRSRSASRSRRVRPGGRDRGLDLRLQVRARRPGAEPGEELAVPLRPLDRRRDDGSRPEPERPRPSPRRHASTRRWTARSRTTPPGTSARPASNWGFTRATIVPAWRSTDRHRSEDRARAR